MPSIHPNYEYDIFISYRQNDNKRDKWVTNFVEALKGELEATLKNSVSIYFDENPHDGLLETHQVSESLDNKLKCLVFIPIISQTYCDTASFAWSQEMIPFLKMVGNDDLGMNIRLANGNVASRVLPVRIHDLDAEDRQLLEKELNGPLRSIDFIHQAAGVNRPLSPEDDKVRESGKVLYSDQINKVANALKEIGVAVLKKDEGQPAIANSKISKRQITEPVNKTLTRRRLSYGLGILLIIIIGLFSYRAMTSEPGNLNAGILDNKSIAVLYFDNMSGDPDQDYFSDGVTEEIIARLTQIDGIRVISRTSSRVYKGKAINLKQIAEELNVSAVLEGSFRKSGNQIKVTAQLINAQTDEHVWAETFTRELKDVFQVQTDIAHQIASKFEIDITPEVDLKISQIPTKNVEAYEYFLRGKHLLFTVYSENRDSANFEKTKKMFETAIVLDSLFAEPFAGLGELYDIKRQAEEDEFSKADDSIRYALSAKAFKLSPNSSWVNNGRSFIFLNRNKMELDSGFYYTKRAWELDPNDTYNLLIVAGFYNLYSGLYEHSLKVYNRIIELDPLTPNVYSQFAGSYMSMGDFDNWFKYETIHNELNNRDNYGAEVFYYLLKNQPEKAAPLIEKRKAEGKNVVFIETLLLARQGNKEAARAFMKENNIQVLPFMLMAGMKEEALKLMNESSDPRHNSYLSLKNNPLWDPYRQDADFKAMLDSIKPIYEERVKKFGPYVNDFLK